MDTELVKSHIDKLFFELDGNTLSKANKVKKEYYGIDMFEAPLVGIGSTDDELFTKFKEVGVIGPWHMNPDEWLPGAKTVISLFFPLTEEVRRSNYDATTVSSKLWAYARIDGQEYIEKFMAELQKWFASQGVKSCVPADDPRFAEVKRGRGIKGYDEMDGNTFGSKWSERHIAYLCGLGTFSLSKGIITEKGIAGRFASIIIDAPLDADIRPYTGIYDYCNKCGACISRCPRNAIDPETGKDHKKCMVNIVKSGILRFPRYGCGICHTKVPCEDRIPIKE